MSVFKEERQQMTLQYRSMAMPEYEHFCYWLCCQREKAVHLQLRAFLNAEYEVGRHPCLPVDLQGDEGSLFDVREAD